jgi:hypothetical protein
MTIKRWVLLALAVIVIGVLSPAMDGVRAQITFAPQSSESGQPVIGGSGSVNQIAVWSAADALTGSNDLIWNGTNLSVGNAAATAGRISATWSVTDPTATRFGLAATFTTTLTADNAQTSGGLSGDATLNQGAANQTATVAGLRAVQAVARVTGASGTVTSSAAHTGAITNTGAGTITSAHNYLGIAGTNTGGGTVTNFYGFRQLANTVGTNIYGLASEIAAAANRWNVYASGTAANYFAGQVGIGTNSLNASALLHLASTTQGFLPPSMTTTQRNAISSPASGLTIYNTSTNALNIYNGTSWGAVGGGGGAFSQWTEVTGTSQTMTSGQGYIANNAALVTLTLPTTCALGEQMAVVGKGAGGWKIAQNAGQWMVHGTRNDITTVGTGGYMESLYYGAAVVLTCMTANTTWSVMGN